MAERRRVAESERVLRVNVAAELLAAGMPVAEAARRLADRFDVSSRQGYRYAEQAARSGPMALPEPRVVFSVKLPARLADRVRGRARETGTTISALVTQALTEFVSRNHGRRPGR